jgi:hypothetical protein
MPTSVEYAGNMDTIDQIIQESVFCRQDVLYECVVSNNIELIQRFDIRSHLLSSHLYKKVTFSLFCHYFFFYMNWSSFKRSPVLEGHIVTFNKIIQESIFCRQDILYNCLAGNNVDCLYGVLCHFQQYFSYIVDNNVELMERFDL